MTTAPIRAGDTYDNHRGTKSTADCDGMLVRVGAFCDVVPLDRLVSICGELGCKIKRRRDDGEKG